MRFHDKVALITAAASGIGRATADIIAQEGGIVVAVDNHEERLDRTVAQLNEAGGRAHRRLCNALDEKDVQATVGSIVREFGRIDILVNAARRSISICGRPSSRSWTFRSSSVILTVRSERISSPPWTAPATTAWLPCRSQPRTS